MIIEQVGVKIIKADGKLDNVSQLANKFMKINKDKFKVVNSRMVSKMTSSLDS